MYIKNVTLKNFGPHRNLFLEFDRGLVGLFGPNGCGKSTITDGIYAALTNDFGRFAGVKTDNINDSMPEGEGSSIEIEAEHDGIGFQLYRGIKPSKNELTISGRAGTLTKSTDIQVALEEQLGVNRRLIDTYVFVPQWKMFQFLSQTPGDRAKAYQHLCNTSRAQEIHDAIGVLLGQDADLRTELVDNSDELRALLAETRGKEQRLKAEIREHQKKTATEDKLLSANRVLAARIAEPELEKELSDWETKRDEAAEILGRGELAAGRAESFLEDIEKLLVVLSEQKEDAEQHIFQWDEHTQAKSALAELNSRQDRIQAQIKKLESPMPPADVDKFDDLQKNLGALHAKNERAEEVLAAFDAEGVVECPTCGTSVDDLHDHLEKLNQELLVDAPAEEELEEKLDAIRAYRRADAAWQKELGELDAKLERVKGEFAGVVEVAAPSMPLKEAQEVLADYDEQSANQRKASARLANLRETQAGAKSSLEAAEFAFNKARRKLKDNRVTDDQVAAASKLVAEDKAASKACDSLGGELKATEESAAGYERQLTSLKAAIARGKKAREFAKVLEDVKLVMHRQALPQIVAQRNLESMEVDINAMLELFGNPFWVETSEDLSFNVHFPGQPPRWAERLSGGQKGVLAVAFRTTIGALFGAEIGMMALDEPTAGMDSQNVDYLSEALTRYAGQIRGKRQVIMITHSDSLRPAFDQIVEVGAYAGED